MKPYICIQNYQGRLGNHMFQFAWALAASKELDYNLSVPGIACDPYGDTGSLFPKTHGFRHYTKEDYESLKDIFIQVCENGIFIKDSYLDFDYIKQNLPNNNLLGIGYFQNYNTFKKYKSLIKEYFSLSNFNNYDKTLAVHIRLDDMPHHFRCQPDYYYKCIEMSSCEKVMIFTDEPSHSFIEHLKQKYKHVEVDTSYTCTGQNNHTVLSTIASCKEIAISKSTFSWWAAYLSNADKIYFPNSNEDEYFSNKNFLVDEKRYITVI